MEMVIDHVESVSCGESVDQSVDQLQHGVHVGHGTGRRDVQVCTCRAPLCGYERTLGRLACKQQVDGGSSGVCLFISPDIHVDSMGVDTMGIDTMGIDSVGMQFCPLCTSNTFVHNAWCAHHVLAKCGVQGCYSCLCTTSGVCMPSVLFKVTSFLYY